MQKIDTLFFGAIDCKRGKNDNDITLQTRTGRIEKCNKIHSWERREMGKKRQEGVGMSVTKSNQL